MLIPTDSDDLRSTQVPSHLYRHAPRGLVARAPSVEDGRAIELFLTRQGLALVERLRAQFILSLTTLTDRLNPTERRRLQELLRRMLDPQ